MRLPRIRLSTRKLMIAVAVMGFLMGLVSNRPSLDVLAAAALVPPILWTFVMTTCRTARDQSMTAKELVEAYLCAVAWLVLLVVGYILAGFIEEVFQYATLTNSPP
jgi:hypothetical protein